MAEQVQRLFSLMVPGAKSSAEDKVVYEPFDNSPIGAVAVADRATIDTALATAYGLYKNRDKWLPMAERIDILNRAATIMGERAEELALLAAREGGKPLIDSRVEVARAIDSLHICVETLRTEAGYTIPMNVNAASANRMAVTRPEPIGVVVAVSAFNHPLNLIAHQVAPAVATGCPVVVKPAEITCLSCLQFVEILREAGLPDEWCQPVVTDNRATSEALVTDNRVGLFSFIGSAKAGWGLRSKLSPGTRCALEHGGAAPAIIAADADMEIVLPAVLKGGFYHAGQVCVSVQRVFVDKNIARDFAEKLAAEAVKLKVGDPTDDSIEVGPLIRTGEVDRVAEWVEEAVAAGAELLCGGAKISDSCYQPTVLYNPPADVKVSAQEIFGPVVCVYPYDDMDAAIEQANALPFAFQAAVFTANMDTALRAYSRLEASAVMINDHTAFRVDWMPFAGLDQSGLGVGGVPHSMEDMTVQKMMVIKSPEL